MRIYFCVYFFAFACMLIACNKRLPVTETITNQQDTTKHVTDSLIEKKTDMGSHVFNQWLGSTLGSTLPIDTNEINKAKFKSFENYEHVNEKVKALRYFEVRDIQPEITIKPQMIMLAYEGSNFERFICFPDLVIISYHANFGDVGGSYRINLKTNEVKESDYTIYDVNGHIANVANDFISDDDGHIYVKAKMDLRTDSVFDEVED